jgi:dipeptidyl aminopeptidase/acylaminoacyl peptidase
MNWLVFLVLWLMPLVNCVDANGNSRLESIRQKAQKLDLQLNIRAIEARCRGQKMCVREIPMRDFFRNPEIAGFSISPDGQMLAFLKPWNQRLNVFVIPMAEVTDARKSVAWQNKAKQITFVKDRDLSGFFFKGHETIVYVRDFGGDENFHLFGVNLNTGEEKDLTPFEGVKASIIDDLKDHPDSLIVGLNKDNPQVFDAYRLNIRTGELVLAAKNPGNITGWETDHNGKIRMANVTDGVNSTLLYRETESEEFSPIMTTNFKEGVSPLFFDFDNKTFYASSNIGRDKSVIVRYNPVTKQEEEVIFSHPEVDVHSLSWSRKYKKLIAVQYTRDKREREFLDAGWASMYARLQSEFPGLEVGVTDLDDSEDKFLIRTWSDRSLGAWWYFEASSGQFLLLAQASPWIREEEMAPMTPISYTARDGLKIPGYLTLPLKAELKNLPVVILVHGGPWARDSWGYRPEVQFFANRGYAVLQMNFRGSTGYGRAFWEKSFKQWGKTMQDDITDGVNWLISQGIADKKRVAIYGASYGGYAVLAGLAFTPDLYACGVDYVGVSNIFTLLETIPPYWKPMLEMMYEMVGHPEKEAELLRAASPVFHVDKIKTPLFIAQGARDPRVKKSESDQMVEALKARGVEVPYMVKDNEGHGFGNEENRFEFYAAVEKFFAKHLK